MLSHNSKNYLSRPMTVNYQVPLDTIHCKNKRPFSSHIRHVENYSYPLPFKTAPIPNIREICQQSYSKDHLGNLRKLNLYSEIPKKTIAAKCKNNVFNDHKKEAKKPKDDRIFKLSKLPSMTRYTKNFNTETQNQKILITGSQKRMLTKPENGKDVDKPCKICKPLLEANTFVGSETLRVQSTKINEKSLPNFKMSEFTQIDMDSSSYLMKEIDNIKAGITKLQDKNSKINILDAIKLINDIKIKIKAAHSTAAQRNRTKRPARVKTPTKIPIVHSSRRFIINSDEPLVKKCDYNRASQVHTVRSFK